MFTEFLLFLDGFFQFFLSNIRLVGARGAYDEPDVATDRAEIDAVLAANDHGV